MDVLVLKKNLKFIEPGFHTFVTKNLKAKQDIILISQAFNIFHYIFTGNFVGSHHIPS